MRSHGFFLALLAALVVADANAQQASSSGASDSSGADSVKQQRRELVGMDWMTAEDNRPQPEPAGGGLFEPMDWSVVRPDEPLRFEPLPADELRQLLSSKLRDDLPHCLAAVFPAKPPSERPILIHAYGRLGGGNGFVKINGAMRSAAAIPNGGDPGLFSIAVTNFAPVAAFEQWKSSALTNPLPATLLINVLKAERVPGTHHCQIGESSCRRYRATLVPSWHQAAFNRNSTLDPSTGHDNTVRKVDDPPRHNAPGMPRTLDVLMEDPCWGTRDGFVEAYANRSRLLELWHRWTN